MLSDIIQTRCALLQFKTIRLETLILITHVVLSFLLINTYLETRTEGNSSNQRAFKRWSLSSKTTFKCKLTLIRCQGKMKSYLQNKEPAGGLDKEYRISLSLVWQSSKIIEYNDESSDRKTCYFHQQLKTTKEMCEPRILLRRPIWVFVWCFRYQTCCYTMVFLLWGMVSIAPGQPKSSNFAFWLSLKHRERQSTPYQFQFGRTGHLYSSHILWMRR